MCHCNNVHRYANYCPCECEWTLSVKAGPMKLGTNYSNHDNIMWYIGLYCYDFSHDVSWALFCWGQIVKYHVRYLVIIRINVLCKGNARGFTALSQMLLCFTFISLEYYHTSDSIIMYGLITFFWAYWTTLNYLWLAFDHTDFKWIQYICSNNHST